METRFKPTKPRPFVLKEKYSAVVHRCQERGIASRSGFLIVIQILNPLKGKPSVISCLYEAEGEKWYVTGYWLAVKYAIRAFDSDSKKLAEDPKAFKGCLDKEESHSPPWFLE